MIAWNIWRKIGHRLASLCVCGGLQGMCVCTFMNLFLRVSECIELFRKLGIPGWERLKWVCYYLWNKWIWHILLNVFFFYNLKISKDLDYASTFSNPRTILRWHGLSPQNFELQCYKPALSHPLITEIRHVVPGKIRMSLFFLFYQSWVIMHFLLCYRLLRILSRENTKIQ